MDEEAKRRLIEAEDILSELANGYWFNVLDDAGEPFSNKNKASEAKAALTGAGIGTDETDGGDLPF